MAEADIRVLCEGVLHRAGAPAEHATLQTDILLEAELRGKPSHGLLRLRRIVERIRHGVADPKATGRHQWRGDAFLDVDGLGGLGPVVACSALETLAQRVETSGIAVAAIRNNNHLGMMAWYAERMAARGFALIALSTSEALVHPWGGRQALIGTNPIAIGVPAHPHPFVVDLATSLVSMGQIHDYAQRGEPLPEDWALDADGDPTTDANKAREGSIAPFGQAKGYALGLAFEVLVASLTASAIGRNVQGTLDATEPCNKGDLFILLQAGGSGGMAEVIGRYLDEIRADRPASGFQEVLAPGDRSASIKAARLEGVPIREAVWDDVLALSEESR